ncbi:MAG: lipid II:glycine glycyltransferase FemX [Candidatus Saccharicenans sp.]
MVIELADPTSYPGWDDYLRNQHFDVFHSAEWCRVIRSAYGYRPVYYVARENGRLKLLIPMFEISSLLTGKRAVSLPFTDFCSLVYETEETFFQAVNKILFLGGKLGWKFVEFRDNQPLPGCKVVTTFYHHQLNLEPPAEAIWHTLKDTNQRNIKKAGKEGLRVKFDQTLHGLNLFYQLHLRTRKRHGLPAQPWSFFCRIQENLIGRNLGVVVLAMRKNQPVAASLYLYFNGRAIFKYGASDERYHQLRPNNLVMWEAILWLKSKGCRLLSLGRTDYNDQGLLAYKRQWGGQESLLSYSRYYFNDQSEQPTAFREPHWLTRLLKKSPTWLIKMLGRIAYRHFG